VGKIRVVKKGGVQIEFGRKKRGLTSLETGGYQRDLKMEEKLKKTHKGLGVESSTSWGGGKVLVKKEGGGKTMKREERGKEILRQ